MDENRDGAVAPVLEPIESEGEAGDEAAEDPAAGTTTSRVADMVAIRLLTPAQGAVLTAGLALLKEPGRTFAELGRRVGSTPEKAKKTLLAAVHAWHSNAEAGDRLVTTTRLVVTHVRGVTGEDVWARTTRTFGQHERAQNRRVTSQQRRDTALRHADVSRRELRVYRVSPMRELLDALVWHLAVDGRRRLTPSVKAIKSREEWPQNLRKAARKLKRDARAVSRPAPQTFKDFFLALARGCHACRNCGTPILRGFIVNGRRVNRGREFCDDTCKMQAHRGA